MIKIAKIAAFIFVAATFFMPLAESTDSTSSILKLQILLDRANFSPGEIDGRNGTNTQRALAAFQELNGLTVKNPPDADTWKALGEDQTELFESYTITPEDTKGPFTENIPEDFMEKMKLEALNYSSTLELLGEKFHVNPDILRQKNQDSNFEAGDTILVPAVTESKAVAPEVLKVSAKSKSSSTDAQKVTIFVSEKNTELMVRDAEGKVLFYAPVTAGSSHDPLPIGNWKVTKVIKNPTFHYNPDLFWDQDPTHSKGKIMPGPNNPVGVVWIDLTAEHYGVHGTPEPSQIGHSESHGCVRLTNWDVLRLMNWAKEGTEVIFQ